MHKLQLLYHGNCFDGLVSAAIFSRFYREKVRPQTEVVYRAMAHRRGDPYGTDHDATFFAEDNAVMDFRYSPSPRLTWWCDHHISAFLRAEDRSHFESDTSGRKCFDPSAPSCAGLLGRWLSNEHRFDTRRYSDHLYWADVIDSARFASPAQAVELKEPPLQLMALLESGLPESLLAELIETIGAKTLHDAHSLAPVQRRLAPLLERHHQTIEVMRERVRLGRGVAFTDLGDTDLYAFNKFIPYYLHPETRYAVTVTASPTRAKVSVGSNPFDRPDPLVNLAELCGPYGGGGHAVVAAVSLPPDELDTARRAAEEIVNHLRNASCTSPMGPAGPADV